jgi:hypothetical protein
MDQTHSGLPLKPVAADTVVAQPAAQSGGRKLSLPLLTGVVIASMIGGGGGAFNLPQNMAQGAGLAAIVIAWMITLVGMFFLSNTFRTLADKRPDLKAGIYSYAKEGFGSFAGFEMAWGYWLSAAFGNVAFNVDKDRSAAMLAAELKADLFVIATDVQGVYLDWGKPSLRLVARANPGALGDLAFPAGSMAPKVEAACDFASRTGRRAVIGALRDIEAMIAGNAGTSIDATATGIEEAVATQPS